ncbi:MAG: twin-arginine translocase TatA/TatE family subunit [Deltaproteobacteria bacterium]|nr:twin-arginine translocase TatA/TatE family subunit [Deltaproteobacteria bacterium]
MFGLSGTELAIVLILALLLLGPSKLPELARSVGKAVRDFKRATGDIRSSVESEFYRMDQEPAAEVVPAPAKAEGAIPAAAASRPALLESGASAGASAAPVALDSTPVALETTSTPGRASATPAPPPDGSAKS